MLSQTLNSKSNTKIYQIKNLNVLKRGIWVYFLLLIFEGSLRKWLLPSLSNILLIVRDPVAIWLLIRATNDGIRYSNGYTKLVLFITLFGVMTAMIWGHGNLIVALYGARITLLHFPLIFLISKVFSKDDVIQMGEFIIYLTIPMTILIGLQFYSPQNAFVNRGVGGNLEGAGFFGTDDYFRPPGTFSFTAGNSLYYAFAAPFVFFFLFYSNNLKKYIVYLSLIALILSIPLSISRNLFFSVFITILFLITSFWNDSKKTGQIIGGAIAFGFIIFILSKLDFVNTSLGVFTERFTTANDQEGGLQIVFADRVLGGLIGGISSALNGDTPFFGLGIGKGTNVGRQLLVGNNNTVFFLVSEAEWGRIIGEFGLLIGLVVVISRLSITIDMFKKSYAKLLKNDPLPWLILSFASVIVLQGGWSTPTGLGFFVIGGGLMLASLND